MIERYECEEQYNNHYLRKILQLSTYTEKKFDSWKNDSFYYCNYYIELLLLLYVRRNNVRFYKPANETNEQNYQIHQIITNRPDDHIRQRHHKSTISKKVRYCSSNNILLFLLIHIHFIVGIMALHPQLSIQRIRHRRRRSHTILVDDDWSRSHSFVDQKLRTINQSMMSFASTTILNEPNTGTRNVVTTNSDMIGKDENDISSFTSKTSTPIEMKHSILQPTNLENGVPIYNNHTKNDDDVPYYALIRNKSMSPTNELPVNELVNGAVSYHLNTVDDNNNKEVVTVSENIPSSNDSIDMKVISSKVPYRQRFITLFQRGWNRVRNIIHYNNFISTSTSKIGTSLQQKQNQQQQPITLRSIWRHRHARSAEEGIRREFATTTTGVTGKDNSRNNEDNRKDDNSSSNGSSTSSNTIVAVSSRRSARQLSSVFAKANASIERTSRRVVARIMTGLITAMAEEVKDLSVEVDARDETPYRNKHITAVRIQFSRLGFKPLRLGGHDSPSDRQQQRQAVTNHHTHLMDQFRLSKQTKSTNSKNNLSSFAKDNDIYDDDYIEDDDLDHIDADEAFDRIDVDKSGFLDRKELIQALGLAAIVSNDKTLVLDDMENESHVSILEELASDLFELYDVNGDGVVDRKEYKIMVADMAALRNRDRRRRRENDALNESESKDQHNWFTSSIGFIQNKTVSVWSASTEYVQNKTGFLAKGVEQIQYKTGFLTSGMLSGLDFVQNNTDRFTTGVTAGVEFVQNKTGFIYTSVEYVTNTTGYLASTSVDFLQNNTGFSEYVQNQSELLSNSMEYVKAKLPRLPERRDQINDEVIQGFDASDISKSLGSITFSDIKMDLRRLFFGAIPILKHLVPGGPLILEPFTTTITGSFNRNDILNSVLLDAGLRRLVMRALRRRVGFLRDVLEGAMFKGRSWKTFGDETGGGPRVEIPELTNVEFDDNDKLIITGRARVQTSPDAAVINQSFKVRTSIGTRKNGRFIRLEEPELALVLECPENWEKNIESVCDALSIQPPSRPKPLYTFFPIYSPFKLQDDDGFDLGEDNSITSLYIKDGALRFEMSAILRPGRFLGSHYIAFSIPIRTFIVTLDRLVDGIRSARKVKKAAQRALFASDRDFIGHVNRPTSFLHRIGLDRAGDALLGLNEYPLKSTFVAVSTSTNKKLKMKSFFSRFIDGYLQAERDEAKKERLTTAIQDFFGRQGI